MPRFTKSVKLFFNYRICFELANSFSYAFSTIPSRLLSPEGCFYQDRDFLSSLKCSFSNFCKYLLFFASIFFSASLRSCSEVRLFLRKIWTFKPTMVPNSLFNYLLSKFMRLIIVLLLLPIIILRYELIALMVTSPELKRARTKL